MKGGFEAYRNRRDEIRVLPEDTKEEKAEKREQAKLFRMEVLFDNALCIQALISALEEDPNIGESELERVLMKVGVIHPRSSSEFMYQLLGTKQKVIDALSGLRGKSDDDRLAKRLFQSAVVAKEGTQYSPQGELFADTTYPLAVALYVSHSADFAHIDTRTNVGGFFKAHHELQAQESSNTQTFPLIVIRGDPRSSDYVTLHEKGHAENRMIQNSLPSGTRRVVWGTLGNIPMEEASAYLQSVDELKEEPDGEGYARILEYACSCAKDELLADYKANQDSFALYLKHLEKRGGLYDYFLNRLFLPQSSEAYRELWNQYEQILTTNVDAAKRVVQSYLRFNLYDRIEQFRWVLAQIPLDKWKEQLDATLFTEEAEMLNDIYREAPVDLPVQSQREKMLPSMRIFRTFKDELKQASHLPLIPLIRNYMERITEPETEKRELIHTKLREESKRLYILIQQNKLKVTSALTQLRKNYVALCGDQGVDPDINFFIQFMAQEGWGEDALYGGL